MAEKPSWEQIERDRDELVKLPIAPDDALRGLLNVDPEFEPVKDRPKGAFEHRQRTS